MPPGFLIQSLKLQGKQPLSNCGVEKPAMMSELVGDLSFVQR